MTMHIFTFYNMLAWVQGQKIGERNLVAQDFDFAESNPIIFDSASKWGVMRSKSKNGTSTLIVFSLKE